MYLPCTTYTLPDVQEVAAIREAPSGIFTIEALTKQDKKSITKIIIVVIDEVVIIVLVGDDDGEGDEGEEDLIGFDENLHPNRKRERKEMMIKV
eukprot:TRINITY_DN30426_c0_g1_i1.p1 TRINITY_DN30426_c0_g1~~TRINITY_DN30426_c0_g1_i1.p1  ORF type:complete len:104 (+),score=19.63 TRINITY_DN30426_c0_g1_i1:33-314(+)